MIINKKLEEQKRVFSLLKELIEYIFSLFEKSGIEGLLNATNPSINDLLNVLNQLESRVDISKLNAIQAIIFTKLILNDIKNKVLNDEAYQEQFKALIQSLETIDKNEHLV